MQSKEMTDINKENLLLNKSIHKMVTLFLFPRLLQIFFNLLQQQEHFSILIVLLDTAPDVIDDGWVR